MADSRRPPYGDLIESARLAAGISLIAARTRAGVAKDTWINAMREHNAAGMAYQARPRTIAKMADAVGVSPERMETEGQHPEAARILREMRQLKSSQAEERAGAAPLAAVPGLSPADGEDYDPARMAMAAAAALGIPESRRRLIPFEAAEILSLVAAAAADTGTGDPPGAAIFGPDSSEARLWDVNREDFPSPRARAWVLALSRVRRLGEDAKRASSNGLRSRRDDCPSAIGTFCRIVMH